MSVVTNNCEWKTISYKKHRRRRVKSHCTSLFDDVSATDDVEARLSCLIADLKKSDFCRCFLSYLSDMRPQDGAVEQIICYGLGSPQKSRTSTAQLALLLIIRDSLDVACSAFDPAFTTTDVKLLERFGIDVMTENEECRRRVESNSLLYMLHCNIWMYNNILWANWDAKNIRKVVLVGNSFQSIYERLPSRRLEAHYKYIYLSVKWDLIIERPLPEWGTNDCVFNDTSIIRFSACDGHKKKFDVIVDARKPPSYPNDP